MKRLVVLAVLLGLMFGLFTLTLSFAGETAAVPSELPVKGMVNMLDLGAHKCIPCKVMAPIMSELEKEYNGKVAIVFIDVWENPAEGPKYRIRSIPTQIFYDKVKKSTVTKDSWTKAALSLDLSNWESNSGDQRLGGCLISCS